MRRTWVASSCRLWWRTDKNLTAKTGIPGRQFSSILFASFAVKMDQEIVQLSQDQRAHDQEQDKADSDEGLGQA
jgi:hypothetical protein